MMDIIAQERQMNMLKNGGTVLILNIKPLIERGTVQILFLSACMRANSRL